MLVDCCVITVLLPVLMVIVCCRFDYQFSRRAQHAPQHSPCHRLQYLYCTVQYPSIPDTYYITCTRYMAKLFLIGIVTSHVTCLFIPLFDWLIEVFVPGTVLQVPEIQLLLVLYSTRSTCYVLY